MFICKKDFVRKTDSFLTHLTTTPRQEIYTGCMKIKEIHGEYIRSGYNARLMLIVESACKKIVFRYRKTKECKSEELFIKYLKERRLKTY